MTYIACARIQYWNSVDERMEIENVGMTHVQSMTEAMQRIERYYGEDLNYCELWLEGDKEFIFISDDEYFREKQKVINNA